MTTVVSRMTLSIVVAGFFAVAGSALPVFAGDSGDGAAENSRAAKVSQPEGEQKAREWRSLPKKERVAREWRSLTRQQRIEREMAGLRPGILDD